MKLLILYNEKGNRLSFTIGVKYAEPTNEHLNITIIVCHAKFKDSFPIFLAQIKKQSICLSLKQFILYFELSLVTKQLLN
jgi:hypothetical protein